MNVDVMTPQSGLADLHGLPVPPLVRAKLDLQASALRTPIVDALIDTTRCMLDVSDVRVTVWTGGRFWQKQEDDLTEVVDPDLCAFLLQTVRSYGPVVVEDAFPKLAERGPGRPKWFRFFAGMVLRKADGQIVGALCALDRSPRKQPDPQHLRSLFRLAQAAMTISEVETCQNSLDSQSALLQKVLDSINQGITVYDAEFRLIAWNEKSAELMQSPKEKMYFGQPFEEILTLVALQGVYGPGDAQTLAHRRAEQIKASPVLRNEVTFLDGRIIEIDISRLKSGGFMTTQTDVTEERRKSEVLKQAAKRFKLGQSIAAVANEAHDLSTAFAAALASFCDELDLDFGRVFLQRPDPAQDVDLGISCRKTGGGSETPPVIASSARSVTAGHRPAGPTCMAVNGLHGPCFQIHVPFEVLDTNYVFEFIASSPVSGTVLGMEISILLTQQMTRVAERDRLHKLKDEFISTMNHEMRTPLTVIAGTLDLLQADMFGPLPDEAKGMVEIARQNGERLASLIEDILDLDRIETNSCAFELTDLPLRHPVETAIASEQALADERQVTVRLEDRDELSALAHPARLIQAVRNLLSNAIKFSSPGATVSVVLQPVGERVRVSVVDAGSGIPDDFQSHMFEKFTQADGSDKRRANGTGLGLTIVKEVVARLGAVLSYETSPDNGTAFHIDLLRQAVPANGALTA